MEAKGTSLFTSFVRAYEELATLLSRKDFVMHKLPGEEIGQTWGAVQADEYDIKALATLDPVFLSRHQASLKNCDATGEEGEDLKPAALENEQSQGLNGGSDGTAIGRPSVEFNPWAQGANIATVTQTIHTSGETNTEDDMDDIYS